MGKLNEFFMIMGAIGFLSLLLTFCAFLIITAIHILDFITYGVYLNFVGWLVLIIAICCFLMFIGTIATYWSDSK